MPGIPRLLLLTASIVGLAACVSSVALAPFEVATRTWPDDGATNRITFVGEFSTAADLGIKESGWKRLFGFVAGSHRDAMVRPMAVVMDINANVIFVADPDAQCVHRYDLAKGRYRCLTTETDELPIAPVGLAVTEDGWLFASDSRTGRIFWVGPEGKKLQQFIAGSQLSQPTGVYWDNQSDLLYVTDTRRQSIFVFDRNGNLQNEIGSRGSVPGQFNFPTYLWIDFSGELLVTDSLNFRLQRFANNGSFVHTFGKNGDQPGDLSRPKGVATDSFGHIYVVDALMHLVQVFDRNGELLLYFGEQGQGDGQFWLPNGIFVTADNLILVADSYNKRIQVFRYSGPGS